MPVRLAGRFTRRGRVPDCRRALRCCGAAVTGTAADAAVPGRAEPAETGCVSARGASTRGTEPAAAPDSEAAKAEAEEDELKADAGAAAAAARDGDRGTAAAVDTEAEDPKLTAAAAAGTAGGEGAACLASSELLVCAEADGCRGRRTLLLQTQARASNALFWFTLVGSVASLARFCRTAIHTAVTGAMTLLTRSVNAGKTLVTSRFHRFVHRLCSGKQTVLLLATFRRPARAFCWS